MTLIREPNWILIGFDFGLFLLCDKWIKVAKEFLRLYHTEPVFSVYGKKLVIDYNWPLLLWLAQKRLHSVVLLLEIWKTFPVMLELLLLIGVLWSKNSFFSVFEPLLFGINDVKNPLYVLSESMWIDKKGTERSKVFKHFIDSFSDYQDHLKSIT